MPRGPAILFILAALLTGTAIGYSVAPTCEEAPPPPPAPAADVAPAPPDLDALCAGRVTSDREQLVFAQAQVDAISAELAQRQKELTDARAAAERATDQKDALVAKARKLEGEVGALKSKLTEATSERDKLLTELKETVEKLDAQVVLTAAAKSEAESLKGRVNDEQWSRFVAEAKVSICAKGSRNRHEQCVEAVGAALGRPHRDAFLKCTTTGQATPTLGRLEKKQKLPEFAMAIPDQKDFSDDGWYIQMCDPTLPEAARGPSRTEPAAKDEPAPAKDEPAADPKKAPKDEPKKPK